MTKQEATLEVRITKVETWQEEIPYTTETTKMCIRDRVLPGVNWRFS